MTIISIFTVDVFAQDYDVPDSISDPLLDTVESPEVCYAPEVRDVSVVRYEDGAAVELRFDHSEVSDTSDYYLYKKNDTTYTVASLSGLVENQISFQSLPLGEVYYLYGRNTCGSLVPVTSINTNKVDSKTVIVSQKLFELIGKIKDTTSLYDLFTADNTVSDFVKLSFIQDYMYGDTVFRRSVTGPYPILHGFEAPACNCKIVKTLPNSNTGIVVPTTDIDLPNYYELNEPSAGWIVWDVEGEEGDWNNGNYSKVGVLAGAAKFMNTFAYGKRQATSTATYIRGDNLSTSNYSQIQMIWTCLTAPYGIKDNACGCSKTVDYSAQYSTRLEVECRKVSCWPFCGSKGGESKAEDWAALFLTDNYGRAEVLKAGRGTIEANFNHDFNPEWFMEVFDLAENLVINFALKDTFSISDIEMLADDIEGILTTNIYNINGPEHITRTETYFNTNGTFELKPNRLTRLMLMSSGFTEVQGYTAWKGEARIGSDYRLAAAIPGGTSENPSCCSDASSAYLVNAVPTSPSSESGLRDAVADFLDLVGPGGQGFTYYENTDYGLDIIQYDCPPVPIIVIGPKEEGGGKTVQVEDKLPMRYRIYDIMGRKISESEIENPMFNIEENRLKINAPDHNGLYFLEIEYSNNNSELHKFYNNRNISDRMIYLD